MGRVLFLLSSLATACLGDVSNFYWYDKTQTLSNRQTMVHLFEWKWTDIAAECESFLQYYGYGAVQISPPNEHIVFVQNNDVPWWIRYQPVSYKLQSRSGSEAQFKDMVDRCNKVGVRIIVDVVMNHMVGVSQKFGVNGRNSSGGTDYDGTDGVESFPGVPYTSHDFNDFRCHGDIQGSDYQTNAEHVKNCRLSGLLDLNQGSPTVRKVLIAYVNKLIDYGVAGFRCDASKHMWPEDLKSILSGTKDLRADFNGIVLRCDILEGGAGISTSRLIRQINFQIFGANQRPFVVHEVIDRGGEAVKCTDYLGIGRYTNFNFGAAVSSAAKGQSDWKLLSRLGPGYQHCDGNDNDVLNFIDNHDNQRDDNPYVVTYKDADQYKLAVAFMLAWPYGYLRVMSSYYFTQHSQGPPNLGAANGYATASPSFNPVDQTCNQASGWVCEHRWPTIREMTKFRAAVQGTAATEISNFSTTLPPGAYCDQFAGSLVNGKCSGEAIIVNEDGSAYIEVRSKQAVAFSLPSRLGGLPSSPVVNRGDDFQKTVVFIKKDTYHGQNLFIRGGISHANNDVCSTEPYQQSNDRCAVPIIHNTTVPFLYTEYLSWSQDDQFLDFAGAEKKQGTHNGEVAFGTPLAYTSNKTTDVEYQPYNKYGSGYWMAQLLVDCSKTDNGWFELKGYASPNLGWEQNINQQSCVGDVGGSAPFRSTNHIAKCGAVNVFTWGSGDCIIDHV